MAIINIEIVSKETIKPLHNKNLKSYKLSLLDEIAPSFYIPIVLFYSNPKNDKTHTNPTIVVQKLKSSLSQTLSNYYPLAGTITTSNDASFVEVHQNDSGVSFTEARVHADLSAVLEKPDTSLVQRLLPIDPYIHGCNGAPAAVMAVQSSEFDCGGIAVGVCVSHKIADGTTLSSFLSAWSSYSGGGTPPPPPELDAAEMFPPREIRLENHSNTMIQSGKIVARRFVFNAPGLAKLRAEASEPTTRVEAVTALISKIAIETDDNENESMVILHVVNLRGRTNPPLPESAAGNIWSLAAARVPVPRSQSVSSLAGRVREEIRKMDIEFCEKLKRAERFVEALQSLSWLSEVVSEGVVPLYKFTSWVRFPIYEVDLGLGNPAWACTAAVPIEGAVVLMSDKCGDGIEAWVNLEENHIASFQTNLDLLSFASLAPGS